jgi:hypothetical protein
MSRSTDSFGERSLRHAVREYMMHYHSERNHQGLNNKLLTPLPIVRTLAPVQCHERGWYAKVLLSNSGLAMSF